MKNIQNIIFDLGGLFIEIDYLKTERAFVDLGVANFNDIYSQHKATTLFEELETGKISEERFYDGLRETTKIELTDTQIKYAWNAMLGDFYIDHFTWLEKIRHKYRIYLFSNTNVIHYDAVVKNYKSQTRKEVFDDLFIKAYYSHTLGLRKPYPEAFKAVIKNENLVAEQTLFIDDTLKNIEGAKVVGLNTIHLLKATDLINVVTEYFTLQDEI